jgi:hypothetical protein
MPHATCTTFGDSPRSVPSTSEAADLFARLGPTGQPPRGWMFSEPPSPADWTTQLGGQTRIAVTSVEALEVVRDAWDAVVDKADLA